MKAKEISAIVEERFKTIHKLSGKIIKQFNADDVHDFRVEVKKLRAFLRLINAEKTFVKPLLPALLKTFYGYVGVVRNIHLHRNNLLQYLNDNKIAQPATYIQLINTEETYWQKRAIDLMENISFKDAEDGIIKQLPDKLKASSAKKFINEKLVELKEKLQVAQDDETIHTIRKILKDILYTWPYIPHDALPAMISTKEDLKLLTTELGDFRDKCIQLEFFSNEYLDKVTDENEKNNLLQVHENYLSDKRIFIAELSPVFTNLLNDLLDR